MSRKVFDVIVETRVNHRFTVFANTAEEAAELAKNELVNPHRAERNLAVDYRGDYRKILGTSVKEAWTQNIDLGL